MKYVEKSKVLKLPTKDVFTIIHLHNFDMLGPVVYL